MAAKETQEPGKQREYAYTETPSSLHDALVSKVQGEEQPASVAVETAAAPAPEAGDALSRPISLFGPGYLDLAIFCRQFATLTEVGIPVLRALQMLARRTANSKLRRAVEETAKGVEEGQMIHQSMARHTRVFSPMVVNIVRIGETGGLLESSLARLADIMESKARIKRKIVSASMYPLVALCVAIAVIILIMVKAIPVFASVYEQNQSELPPLTQFIIKLSDFFVGAWWFIAVLLVLGFIGLKLWARSPSGARFFSWLAMHLPVFKNISQKIAVARSARTLGGLVTAGIPLVDALGITGDTSENVMVADALKEVHDIVERGERMAGPLARAGIYPTLVVDMIAIGEETGTLDSMLVKVADIYDVEVDSTLDGLSSIIEPILIILLGGVVVFIALAVLMPYFNLVKVVE